MKERLKNNKTLLGIVFLGLVALFLPITLLLVRDTTNLTSRAALPSNLEAESGTLSTGVSKQNDSNASGGQFIRFDSSSGPTPTSPPSSRKNYGSGIAMDTKSNVRIGPIPEVSVSFRASTTSRIKSVAWQLREGSGYSLGDCGIARISVQNADENGKPLGSILGSLVYDVPCFSTGGFLIRNTFPTNSMPSVEEGKMYAVMWENTHSNPTSNYWSVNKNLAWSTTPTTPGYPDHFAWETRSGAWLPDSRHSIGFDVEYENGQYDGLAYHNTMLGQAVNSVISGNSMVRERITTEGANKIATGIFVRASKLFGNSPLAIGIYEGSNLLRSITVPSSEIISWDPNDPNDYGWKNTGDWEGGSFSPLTLESGKTYFVRLSTNSDTKYHSIGIFHTQDNTSDGSSYPLTTRLNGDAFREGVFEYSTNAGASWSKVYPHTTPGNMQMYFTLQ